MAVQSDTSRIQYAGNNSTSTSYAVPFVFLENSHLQAIARTSAGVESTVTLTNHAGAGNVNGGTVRTAVAIPATSTLTIYREVPITQTTSYAEGGDFPAASHERALDKLTYITQQLDRRVDTCIRGSEAAPIAPLPSPIGTQQFVLATTANQTPAWQPQSAIAIGPVIATGSSEPRFVSDRFADVINVKDFGAVGDGVADDTAAIQAAINAAGINAVRIFGSSSPKGAKVFFPAGDYLISNELSIPVRVIVEGSGQNATQVKVSPTFPSTAYMFRVNSTAELRNMTLIGTSGSNFDVDPPLARAAVFCPTANKVVVRDVQLITATAGLFLDETQNSLFENIQTRNCLVGFELKAPANCKFVNLNVNVFPSSGPTVASVVGNPDNRAIKMYGIGSEFGQPTRGCAFFGGIFERVGVNPACEADQVITTSFYGYEFTMGANHWSLKNQSYVGFVDCTFYATSNGVMDIDSTSKATFLNTQFRTANIPFVSGSGGRLWQTLANRQSEPTILYEECYDTNGTVGTAWFPVTSATVAFNDATRTIDFATTGAFAIQGGGLSLGFPLTTSGGWRSAVNNNGAWMEGKFMKVEMVVSDISTINPLRLGMSTTNGGSAGITLGLIRDGYNCIVAKCDKDEWTGTIRLEASETVAKTWKLRWLKVQFI